MGYAKRLFSSTSLTLKLTQKLKKLFYIFEFDDHESSRRFFTPLQSVENIFTGFHLLTFSYVCMYVL